MPGRPYYVVPKGGPFSFIEKGVKGLARGLVPGFSTAESVVRSLSPSKPRQGPVIQGPSVHTSGGTSVSLGQIQLPGGFGLSIPGFGPSSHAPQGGTCPPGYHLDKKTRTKCVRNRSTNFGNGKATSRAVRRLKGAEKQFKKVLRVLGSKTGRVVPRGKRRAR